MAARFTPTKKHRTLIASMLEGGASREEIAQALGCSPSTLKRHFAADLNGKKPRGVPAREFTEQDRELVLALVGFGIPNTQITRLLGISLTTLKQSFPEELAVGVTKANAAVATSLFRNATTGMSVRAQIFWLRSRAGWVESGGDEGRPVPEDETDALRTSIAQLDADGRKAYRVVLTQLGAKSRLSIAPAGPDDTVQ